MGGGEKLIMHVRETAGLGGGVGQIVNFQQRRPKLGDLWSVTIHVREEISGSVEGVKSTNF